MKRLPPIVASAVLLFAGGLHAAALSGKVSFQTKRGQNPAVSETLVWLEPQGTLKAPHKPPATFQMVTRNKLLIPHVLAIPVGSTVEFPNDDPISHNLFSLSGSNGFDLGLYRRAAGKAHKFDSPGIVNVYCNVHPSMSSVIHVMSSPYYTFAAAAGAYSFDVPPGRYRVVAWNEQGGTTESVVDVPGAGAANVVLTIDSRNYRAQSHTNKEGKAYQAPREY